MAALRRTRVAHFTEAQAVTLQTLKDAYVYAKQGQPEQLLKIILPVESAVSHMKKIIVLDSAINAITHGVQLKVPGIAAYDDEIKAGDTVAVYSLKGELVCVGEARLDANRLSGNSGLAVKTARVYLAPETYPRMQ
jgi:H/ACA ribonucleoprotein complex subunit 4